MGNLPVGLRAAHAQTEQKQKKHNTEDFLEEDKI